MKSFLLALLVAASAVSCAPTRDQRIASNAAYFQSLSPTDQVLVRQGAVRIGLPQDAVYLALGDPDRIGESVPASGKPRTTWTYLGYRPVYSRTYWPVMPVVDRCGRVYYYHNPGPEIYYIPYVRSKIHFTNRLVSGWETDHPRH